MKSYMVPIIAFLATAVSCSVKNEPVTPVADEDLISDNNVEPQGDDAILEIRGIVEDSVDAVTKTTITEDGSKFHSAWVNGNTIRVDVDGFTKKTGTYDSSKDLFTCSISSLTEGSHTINAAYPLSTGTASSTKYSFTVPTSQTIPSINAIDESADFLVAKTETIKVDETGKISTLDMNFRRAVAIVKVIPVDGTTDSEKSLSGLKIKGITITSGANIPTKIKITPGSEDDATETNKTEFTVSYAGDDFKFNEDISGTDGAYIVFAPGKFTGGKSLKFDIETDDDTYTISKTISSLPDDIEFGANQLRPITVTFTDDCVEVTTITPEISANDVNDVPVDGRSSSIDVTFTNATGWTPSVASITGCVSAATLSSTDVIDSDSSANSLNYTVPAYDGVTNTGTVVIRLTKEGESPIEKTVNITQYTVTILHTYEIYRSSSAVVNLSDGVAGSYFTTSGSNVTLATSLDAPSGTTRTNGIKLDGSGHVTFTTSATLNTTITFYSTKRADGTGSIEIRNTNDDTVAASSSSVTYGSVTVIENLSLEKNKEYKIQRTSGELVLLYAIVTES